MKSTPPLSAVLCVLLLTGCDVAPNGDTAQAELERATAELEAQSARLQAEIAELRSGDQRANAELAERLEALEEENRRLLAQADIARQQAIPAPTPLPSIPSAPVAYPAPGAPQGWLEPTADYSSFYEPLSAYGRWLEVDGYGYAWSPHLASQPAWRPYLDGRWLWSDYGWTWSSREPFGWACYHYGRWVRLTRHGWVWVPGREWAPAWVSWRTGPDCIGWAPLPPGPSINISLVSSDCDLAYGLSLDSYCFIESSRFGSSSFINLNLSLTQVTRLFAGTVNVTRLVRVDRQGGRLFAHQGGPERSWYERRFGRPAPRAEVRLQDRFDLRALQSHEVRSGVTHFTAATLPDRRDNQPLRRPHQIERVERPVLEDGWQALPTSARQSLREVVQRQVRDPRPVGTNPSSASKDGTSRDGPTVGMPKNRLPQAEPADAAVTARGRAEEALQRAQESRRMDEQRKDEAAKAAEQATSRQRGEEALQRAQESRRMDEQRKAEAAKAAEQSASRRRAEEALQRAQESRRTPLSSGSLRSRDR